MNHTDVPGSIFRAYDIRGVVDKTLTVDIARKNRPEHRLRCRRAR